MAKCGMLRDYRFTESAEDIRGSHLYGTNDDKLGKIDDVIFDHVTGQINYIVVDTGGWLSTKKFVVPANRLHESSQHQGDFAVDLTKKQVEGFPPYDEAHLESDELWADYEGRYRAKWEADPVMHRLGTDRNITPTTEQLTGNPNSERAADLAARGVTPGASTADSARRNSLADKELDEDIAAQEITSGDTPEQGYAASTDTVVIDNSANGIGPRWDTFQDRLRERRKEVINAGSTPESADRLRRAS
ncbi:MAG: PRC-barrel domain-containing protein [Candidatus Sulfotelmatobacter sp.]